MEQKDLLDQEVLDELVDIMGDDMSMLIDSFKDDSQQKIALLGKMSVETQQQEIFKMAHSIKGSARNVGLSAFADLCEHIETQARAGVLTLEDFDLESVNSLFVASSSLLSEKYQ
jgi:HPt (histidine-containing phosphotransfer) domain-containing protein